MTMKREKKDMRLVKEQIARNIKQRRAELGITQVELARRAGLSVSGVSYIESASREPLASTLQKLASGLDWEVSDLLVGVRWVEPRDSHEHGHIERSRQQR
jgi:transcriptional regulator with XRE-family HTH domain